MLRIHRTRLNQSKLSRLSWLGLAGTVSCCALVSVFGLMLFPSLPQVTYAAIPEVTPSTGTSVGINLPASIDFDSVTPTPDGATTTATANLTVTTTNSASYSLYLYSSDGDNSLRPKISANTSSIIATAGGVGLTLSSLEPNTWGYNLGTTTPDDSTTYSAVPTDNSTPIQTKDTSDTNSANDTYTLSFGAKVDSTIASGAYSNALTVAVVAEPKAITYIQDLTLSECQSQASDADLTVKDKRDDNDYTVRYINGACWMTQNLRLTGGQTLTSEESNIVGSWEFPNNSLTLGNSYTEARSAISADPEYALEYGGYYNYCAASAGTACSSSSAQNATQDICPKGWRLPTGSEMDGITSYVSAFSPVYSGNYNGSSLSDTGSSGYWWSASVRFGHQLSLRYSSGSLNASLNDKYRGFSVRCIRSNPGTLTINFDGNGSTGGSTASQQIAAGNTASLNTNGFTRTGYVFTGWNTAADGSGIGYADGADYTVTPATGDATITLYAQWGPSIQDFTNAQCQSLASNNNYTVYDERDGSDYTVRYINGACWMTSNLRLSGGRTLTPSDSNVDSNWTFPNNSLIDGDSYTEARFILSDDPQYATEYGGYYNYCAASAGSVCAQTEMDATQSICPAGWTLPTGGSNSQQSGITSYVDAFSPVLSGFYSNGSLYNTGSYGYWWSATAYSSAFQYSLRYDGSSLDTRNNLKYVGYSVRCIRSS